jgi:membrane fusion protein (multidrug efflux system)
VTKRIIAAAFAAVVLGAAAWIYLGHGGESRGSSGAQQNRGHPVVGVIVHKETVADRIEALGTIYANESVSITAKTQGIIRAVDFDDGQTFKKGEQIAAIDAGEQDAQLNVELANLEQQKKDLDRTMGLAADRHVSQSRVDEQVALVKKAEANVAAARVRSGDRRIIAPFGGIVGTRRISVGALVSPGTVIATLDDISTVKLDFSVPETFMTALKPGLDIEARASAYAGQIFKGNVVSVDSRIDPVTRSVAVRALMPNPDLALRPGMLMVVDLIKDQRESIVIPEGALIAENGKHHVFTITPDNVVHRIDVVMGRRRVGWIEVLQGLSEGDVVVKEGIQDLRTGTKVNILNAADLRGRISSGAARSD